MIEHESQALPSEATATAEQTAPSVEAGAMPLLSVPDPVVEPPLTDSVVKPFAPVATPVSPAIADILSRRRASLTPVEYAPEGAAVKDQTIHMRAGYTGLRSTHTPTSSACEIPQGLTFEGTAHYPCSVQIKGCIKGSLVVEKPGEVVIAETGQVDGEMKSQSITVNGSASGTVDASGGSVNFGPQARCEGNIFYARVSIAEGAEIEATMKKAMAN